jgi:uncharacterized protein (TIGR03905 family)
MIPFVYSQVAIDISRYGGYTASNTYAFLSGRSSGMKLSFGHDGSCTKKIVMDIDNGRIVSTEFIGGQPGNPQVLAALAEGMEVSEAISLLQSIACNDDTSCPGRLARSLAEAVAKL